MTQRNPYAESHEEMIARTTGDTSDPTQVPHIEPVDTGDPTDQSNRAPMAPGEQIDDPELIRPGKPFDPRPFITRLKKRGDDSGKDAGLYLEVAYRKVWLRAEHPNAKIETELVKAHDVPMFANNPDKKTIEYIVKCTIELPDTGATASALGSCKASAFKDALQKADTNALGRAMSALGYDTVTAIRLDAEAEVEGDLLAEAPIQDDSAQRLRQNPTPFPQHRQPTTNERAAQSATVDQLRQSGDFKRVDELAQRKPEPVPMLPKDIGTDRRQELKDTIGFGRKPDEQEGIWNQTIQQAIARGETNPDKILEYWSELAKAARDTAALVGPKNGAWRYLALIAWAPSALILNKLWSNYVVAQGLHNDPDLSRKFEEAMNRFEVERQAASSG